MYTFQERVGAHSVQTRLRRLGDLTVPNFTSAGDMTRNTHRHNRTIPTLLCPWKNERPDVSRCTMVITKDIGDEGVGLLLTHPFTGPDVVVGFLLPDNAIPEPWYFLGTIQHNTAIGGGFWALGIALHEHLSSQWNTRLSELLPFAHKLLPPK